jgi:hypothetical protein
VKKLYSSMFSILLLVSSPLICIYFELKHTHHSIILNFVIQSHSTAQSCQLVLRIITTTKHLCSDRGGGGGLFDFNNGHLVTRVYSGLSVMSLNHPLLLWPSVAMVLGDIISLSVAIVTIW